MASQHEFRWRRSRDVGLARSLAENVNSLVARVRVALVGSVIVWRVEYDPEARLLAVRMLDVVTARDARDLSQATARALEGTAGAPFRACFDLRKLFPLEEDSVHLVEALKRTCLEWTGCRGLVVLADSPTVAMQQHHTRVRPGTDHELELVTLDKTTVDAFLARPFG